MLTRKQTAEFRNQYPRISHAQLCQMQKESDDAIASHDYGPPRLEVEQKWSDGILQKYGLELCMQGLAVDIDGKEYAAIYYDQAISPSPKLVLYSPKIKPTHGYDHNLLQRFADTIKCSEKTAVEICDRAKELEDTFTDYYSLKADQARQTFRVFIGDLENRGKVRSRLCYTTKGGIFSVYSTFNSERTVESRYSSCEIMKVPRQ